MSLVGRCKEQEIVDGPGGTVPESPFLGGGRLEEIMIKLNILRGTLLEVIWGHDKGALCL